MSFKDFLKKNYDPRLGHHLWCCCVTLTTFVELMIRAWACIGPFNFGLGMLVWYIYGYVSFNVCSKF